jgi:hypothetical protein
MDAQTEDQEEQIDLFSAEQVAHEPVDFSVLAHGKDELNLAEFPLTALSNRVAPGQKTLRYKDSIWDNRTKRSIERQLTITAADEYGLPTAMDDEVILALVQLSKLQGFTSRQVEFSRYEIVQLLNWRDEAWSYKRIEQSMLRWLGVTLMYENAWWNPETKAWMTEGFHILDGLRKVEDGSGKARDAFVWNELIFSSFQKGNLKTLDLVTYRKLNSSIAKRLYRLLDKRFFHSPKIEFDLVDLAFHKLGLSNNYLIGNLKQRLEPAIKELEDIGYVKAADKKNRYRKHGVGQWNVVFEKGDGRGVDKNQPPLLPVEPDTPSGVEARLIDLGVSPRQARRLAITHHEEYLDMKIDEVRYLMAKESGKFKNPAGFLVKSIEEKFSPPLGFQTPGEKAKVEAEVFKKKETVRRLKEDREERSRKKEEERERAAKALTDKVENYLASLSDEDRELVCSDAIKREMAKGKLFSDWLQEDSKRGEVLRKTAIEEHVLQLLGNTN